MGHSLGEYGALVAAGVLPFAAALEAVSARGREMADLQPSTTRARWRPCRRRSTEVERIVAAVDGYVVLANVNSTNQLVLGGATDAVEQAVAALKERGARRVRGCRSATRSTPRSCAGASEPLRATLRGSTAAAADPGRRQRRRRVLPGDGVEEMWTSSAARSPRRCSSSRVCARSTTQGARVFVETGPKRALWGFAADVLGDDGC